MNQLHKKRFYYLCLFAIGLSIAASFIFYALKQNMNVFVTPSDLSGLNLSSDYTLRLGGLVKSHSLIHEKNSLNVQFVVTDLKHDTRVYYNGILPDLFREGKGVIVEGHVNAQGELIASQVLAKHDENYMPEKVYKALREHTT
ncbi:MAG: cytochrome c maturation protein CcmE [Gammaproteobacteria bacterium]|nr:cytochrome c maturation protein CcmE [Gammaproteobacteria bacterium]